VAERRKNMKKTYYVDLASVRAEIARLGFKKKDLAEELGISFSSLSQKLNGKNQFSINELGNIASLTNKPIDHYLKCK
jgi:transcriptional regulator with XRE-family HTH domain